MPNRRVVVLLLLAGISLVVGCKKSSESNAPNFFGSPPVVSELAITKVHRNFDCTQPVAELCCADYPVCSCCCQPDQVHVIEAEIDLVQMSAKVVDADDTDNASNILVVLARFFDPPNSGTTNEISLEMFDVGSANVGTILYSSTGVTYSVISGDAVANDGVYTRNFYMKTPNPEDPLEDCLFITDTNEFSGTFSEYLSPISFPATKNLNYNYRVEAVDKSGNITPSGTVALNILESEVINDFTEEACGPPVPGGNGCERPPP